MMRRWGRPRELFTIKDSSGRGKASRVGEDSFSGDPGTFSQNPRGLQNGYKRLSISIPAVRFLADFTEKDRAIVLKESDRGRALQVRRTELHRRPRPLFSS